jgi:hypothetical protein
MTLSALRTNLPLRLASLHVRGHQDKRCNSDLLSRPAQLNVLADLLATDALMRGNGIRIRSSYAGSRSACSRYLVGGTTVLSVM